MSKSTKIRRPHGGPRPGAGRPRGYPEDYPGSTRSIGFRLPETFISRLDAWAKAHGETRTAALIALVHTALEDE